MRQFATYIRSSLHGFPPSVITKAESLFSDVRQHRSRRKTSRQQAMSSFLTPVEVAAAAVAAYPRYRQLAKA